MTSTYASRTTLTRYDRVTARPRNPRVYRAWAVRYQIAAATHEDEGRIGLAQACRDRASELRYLGGVR